MLGARPKKMMNMYIYDILRRNTDAEHPMTQREIQKRLESDYDMTVDRKAVKANLEDLINDGSYNIEYATKIRLTPNRLTGELEKNEVLTGFYYDNIFTDSELRLLMDSVLFSKSIATGNKKELLDKLKSLSNKYFKFSTANIRSYESVDREINRELFYTIEMLDEAITNGLQVKFLYNEYGSDKKLHHRLNDEGEVRERMTAFVVSSGMAQTNYNLINQKGTVSLDTLEKFSKRLRVEPYEFGVKTEYLLGNVAKEIVKYAEEKEVGLIVIGSRGLGAFSRTLLGSVSNKVINATMASVLVTK